MAQRKEKKTKKNIKFWRSFNKGHFIKVPSINCKKKEKKERKNDEMLIAMSLE